jgi:hypothetical protein
MINKKGNLQGYYLITPLHKRKPDHENALAFFIKKKDKIVYEID